MVSPLEFSSQGKDKYLQYNIAENYHKSGDKMKKISDSHIGAVKWKTKEKGNPSPFFT